MPVPDSSHSQEKTRDQKSAGSSLVPPTLSPPRGGGAIRGIGEKFAANPVTGTGSMTVPISTSAGRSDFAPQLALAYDSGAGNGPFGFGWHLSLASITRKTDKGLPRYHDAEESDTFILSGSEDLVPLLAQENNLWQPGTSLRTLDDGTPYLIQMYRPRVEGLFARIERWTNRQTGEIFWRSISKENVTTLYGRQANSRIADPQDASHVFSWLICESYDDRGNAIIYEYKAEDSENVDLTQIQEKNRTIADRSANRHLKRIKFGNRVSRLVQPDYTQSRWMFEVVFDYGEHDPDAPGPVETGIWLCRHDPFASYRAGFEMRTYRLCQRVLLFHHFTEEPDVGQDCLVRSTDITYQNSRNDPADLKQGNPVASFIASISQNSYRREAGGYRKKS